MFRGTFEHSMDAKGRTSLPAAFRKVLEGRSETELVITQGPDGNLWCHPPAVWAELEKRVRAMPQFKVEVRALMHRFVAPAQDCAVDGMGRVLVPPILRKFAELGTDVVWAGAIDRIELWSADRWKQRCEVTLPGFDDEQFQKTLGDLGI